MALKYALFDLDGTLVDSLAVMVDSFNHVLEAALGRPIPREEVVASLGPPLAKVFERFVGAGEVERCVAEYVARYTGMDGRLSRVYPGIPELLEELRARGADMAVVTAKRRATALATLERFGLASFMRVVVADDDVQEVKPDPESVLMALRQLGARPEQAVMVGDSPMDLQAARAAGVVSAGACWGFYGESELRRHSPDHLLASPEELLGVFASDGPAAGTSGEEAGR